MLILEREKPSRRQNKHAKLLSMQKVKHEVKDLYIIQAFSYEYVTKKYFFLFLNQNICCGYSKEPFFFEHPKHMLKLMGKKIYNLILKKCLSKPI